ncbi:pre-mRNA-splicing factor ATP-dependent RNA helicase prp43 [Fusarium mundagurra]|uniref:Pre-mRNA-splicing factor ATP-dependent RNA helicase prp43 n=1 Tax=Fusarium mundagurra TaxID=1567541 RepID=A0A8H6D9S8_9HYPO|nr:pre-mRNA-splicing factor ATP-dependent RNA helicase prp43 [Fusarium mundagurra]
MIDQTEDEAPALDPTLVEAANNSDLPLSLIRRLQNPEGSAIATEDSKDHPVRPGEKHSEKSFELLKQRRALPVSSRRQEFLNAYHQRQVIILSSETGSRETIQISRFIIFNKWQKPGKIACNKPRRITAMSAAARTAAELDVQVGDEAGYAVCFDRKAHPMKTKLGYMTNGMFIEVVKTDSNNSTRPSVEEVEEACNFLRKEIGDLLVLPLYSHLPESQRDLIFQSSTQRKCVCATSIAEASITIDGIVYVIDLGKSKQLGNSPRMGLDTLVTGLIFKAAARQRAGRAGRTKPGLCYRLYTHKSFMEDMRPSNQPAILESNI